ncbi:putative tetratricopeptide-like helical domain superfamily [Dioscorea sansibarensis]
MLMLLPRPQLPPVTITTVERNEEQECSRGRPSDVLRILDALQLPVDEDTYSALIKECIDSRDAVQGASVHAHIQRRTRSSTRNSSGHLILADRLLLMYAACGRLRDARQLFDEMPMKDAISRLTMISALSDRGDHVEAIKLFVDMHENGCAGGRARFFDAAIAILRSCVRAEDLQLGQQVHGLTLKLVGSAACADSPVVRVLVRLYSGCQDWTDKLLEWMPYNDATAWTSVINGCCKKGQFDRALLVFREMRRLVGNRKKSFHHIHNFQGIFRACAMVEDEGWSGMKLHADAIKTGLDNDPAVGSNLVRMYGKYGRLDYARTAFNAISDNSLRDAASWNAMPASIPPRTRDALPIPLGDESCRSRASGIYAQRGPVRRGLGNRNSKLQITRHTR